MNIRYLSTILFVFSIFLSMPSRVSAEQIHTTRFNLTIPGGALVVENKEGVEHKSVLISDYLSSTKVIISEDGQVIESPSYYPYGESINPTSPKVGNNRYYTNQRKVTDDSTLYNYNARYYNPDYSYFIQPDSVEGPARYSYVSGNPIMNSDPSGHCVQCDNWWMREYITGDHPWVATSFSQDPASASLAKLDAWTGLPSLIAMVDYSPKGKWLDEALLSSTQYVSKSEKETGFMMQIAMAATTVGSGLAGLEKGSAKIAGEMISEEGLFTRLKTVYHGSTGELNEQLSVIDKGLAISPDYPTMSDSLNKTPRGFAHRMGARFGVIYEFEIPEDDLRFIAREGGEGYYGIRSNASVLGDRFNPGVEFQNVGGDRIHIQPTTIKKLYLSEMKSGLDRTPKLTLLGRDRWAMKEGLMSLKEKGITLGQWDSQ